jgi:hypothetical protein
MEKKEYSCMYYEKAMPEEFCDYIIKSTPWQVAQSGTTYDALGEVNRAELRKVDIVSEHIMSPLGCVCQSYLIAGNGWAGWSHSINGFDAVQIMRYTEGGHYLWHSDVLPPHDGVERKVSLVILLNDPSEFEGGELQFEGKEDVKVFKNKGDIVVFPAGTKHRVTPITKGVRYVAVCWAKGFYEE